MLFMMRCHFKACKINFRINMVLYIPTSFGKKKILRAIVKISKKSQNLLTLNRCISVGIGWKDFYRLSLLSFFCAPMPIPKSTQKTVTEQNLQKKNRHFSHLFVYNFVTNNFFSIGNLILYKFSVDVYIEKMQSF